MNTSFIDTLLSGLCSITIKTTQNTNYTFDGTLEPSYYAHIPRPNEPANHMAIWNVDDNVWEIVSFNNIISVISYSVDSMSPTNLPKPKFGKKLKTFFSNVNKEWVKLWN